MSGFEAPGLRPVAQPLNTFVTPAVQRPGLDRIDYQRAFAPLAQAFNRLGEKQQEIRDIEDARDAQLDAQELPLHILEELPNPESDKVREYFKSIGRSEWSPTYMQHLRLHAGRRWVEKMDYQKRLYELIETASDPDSDQSIAQHVEALRGRMMRFLPEQMSAQFKRGVVSRLTEMEGRAKDMIYTRASEKRIARGQLHLSEEVRSVIGTTMDVMMDDSRAMNLKGIDVENAVTTLQHLAKRAKDEGVPNINETIMIAAIQKIEEMSEEIDEDFASHAIDFLRELEVVEGVRFGSGKNGDRLDALEDKLAQDRRSRLQEKTVKGTNVLTRAKNIITSEFNKLPSRQFKSYAEMLEWGQRYVLENKDDLGIDDVDELGGTLRALWDASLARVDERPDPKEIDRIMGSPMGREQKQIALLNLPPSYHRLLPGEMKRATDLLSMTPAAEDFQALGSRLQPFVPANKDLTDAERALVATHSSRARDVFINTYQSTGGDKEAAFTAATEVFSQSAQMSHLMADPGGLIARVAYDRQNTAQVYQDVAKFLYPMPVAEVGLPKPPDLAAEERQEFIDTAPQRAAEIIRTLRDNPSFRSRISTAPDDDTRMQIYRNEVGRIMRIEGKDWKKGRASEKEMEVVMTTVDTKKGVLDAGEMQTRMARVAPDTASGAAYRKNLASAFTASGITGRPSGELAALLKPGGPLQVYGVQAGATGLRHSEDDPIGGKGDYSRAQIRMAAIADAMAGRFHQEAKPDFSLIQEGKRSLGGLYDPHARKHYPNYYGKALKVKSGRDAAAQWGRYMNSTLPRSNEALSAEARGILQMRGVTLAEVQAGTTREGISLARVYGPAWRAELVNQFVPLVAPDAGEQEMAEVADALNISEPSRKAFYHMQATISRARVQMFDRTYRATATHAQREKAPSSLEILKALWADNRVLKLK